MPFEIYDYPKVVVFKEKVYIGGGVAPSDRECQTVIVYDPQKDCYDTLPPYTYKYFSIAVVNNQLVVVGGVDIQTNKRTNQLGVWNEQSSWTHPLPPMTTGCHSPSVATHNNRWLVVMGGGGDGTNLSRVEILDTTVSRQWYQAAPLPQPCHSASTTTVGNMCYLLGGYSTGVPSYKAFSVQLDKLISQAVLQPAGARAPPTPSLWITLPDTCIPPLINSTALAINGALLAVGGLRYNKTVYHYQPSRSWIEAGELPAGRSRCCCTVLPSGEVLVAGGDNGGERVDIAFIE